MILTFINIHHSVKDLSRSNHSFLIYGQNKNSHNFIFDIELWDLVTLTLLNLKHFIDINPMYKFDEDPVFGSCFIAKTIFTWLPFLHWPLTLTLGQLPCLININLIRKYNQDQIIPSWLNDDYKLTLTFDLVTLTLG